MNILALDLGTNVGYAYNQGTAFQAGTWTLATDIEVTNWGKDRSTRRKDPRIERLCEKLAALPLFDAIVFEDVQFSSYRKQMQLWAAYRSAVWLCGKTTLFEAVDVQTLKTFATGKGGVDKASMDAALLRQYPNLWEMAKGSDTVDAIWIHLWARKNLGRIKP